MGIKRRLWTLAGLAFVALAYVGYVTPGLPGTVFLILALYCFRRGSARFERWLLDHPWFGPTIREWDQYKGLRPKTKRLAITMMWCAAAASIVFLYSQPLPAVIVAECGLIATFFIWSCPDVPEVEAVPIGAERQATLGEALTPSQDIWLQ